MSIAPPGMLSPYRVLDLADEKGLLCGKVLGDLGANVIKVERPGGDTARSLGPFYHDEPDPEKSLFWFAYNTSKRGITLNIETADGREIFRRLAARTDFVIETFSPGYLDRLGLGYAVLESVNPRLILVSITAFGQTGPYKDYQTSDLVAWAMGGEMELMGDPDRPPFRISHHSQAYLHAGADGATGALAALSQRWATGHGQHVDVSVLESVAQCTENGTFIWDIWQEMRKRGEDARGGNHRATRIWPCQDGYVSWSHGGGRSRLAPSLPLVKWMEEEGFGDDYLRTFDWMRSNFNETTQDEMDHIEAPTARFFLAHTKAELLKGAIERQVMLYPVATAPDLLENAQLNARGFWVDIEHPELGARLKYPGAFAVSSEAPPRIARRAPLIGEHNIEVYEGEFGIPRDRLVALMQAGVI